MVAGLAFAGAHDSPVEKGEHYKRIQELAKRFKDQNGSIICRELLQGVLTTDGVNPEPRTENYYKKRPCVDLVGDSVEIFEQYLKESKSKV
jgi:hypothetical protein